MSTNQIQFYNNMLKTNICEAVVKGVRGDLTITCTLMDSVVPVGSKIQPSYANQEIPVWNINVKRWDLIKVADLKSFKLLSNSLATVTTAAKSKPAQSDYADVTSYDANPSNISNDVMKVYTPNSSARKQLYLQALRASVCEIEFIKADNTHRVMKATLESKIVDDLGLTPKTTAAAPTDGSDTIKVVDIDAKGWRTITVSKVTSFKTVAPVVTPVNVVREGYLTSLRAGPCEVVFTKADGSQRTMIATLEADKITSLGLASTSANKSPAGSQDVISVVDLDLSSWRSFNINKVLSFRALASTLKRRTTLTAVG